MNLTSIELATILRFYAMKSFSINLNKTQVNKLLYIWYGVYYAKTRKKLCNDESPKAWPYGPVFPRVYKRFDRTPFPNTLPKELVEEINTDKDALYALKNVVSRYFNWSATTTVNVIAIVLILMRGLFPQSKNGKDDDNSMFRETGLNTDDKND